MSTALIDLSKKAKIVLEKKQIFGEKAQVKLILDISGSMTPLYSNGTVQQTVEQILGVAMNMDDNESVEVYAFGQNAHYIGEATPENVDGFVNNVLLKKVKYEYDTRYADAMKLAAGENASSSGGGLFGGLFGKKKAPAAPKSDSPLPSYVVFVTDGNNSDKNETEEFVRRISSEPIFWQFVGIGSERFAFLDKLDHLSGRKIDNANFLKIDNIAKLSDEDLYDRLLTEYPSWLKEARQSGIVQ